MVKIIGDKEKRLFLFFSFVVSCLLLYPVLLKVRILVLIGALAAILNTF
jgi:hypothetical protein